MQTFWTITAPYRGTPAAEAFPSLASAFSVNGQYIASDPISRVIRAEIATRAYFIKTYTAGGKSLRRWFGRSRARAEWENLQFFAHLGIPTAPLVAYGHETWGGLFRRGALVTAELRGTRDLNSLHLENHPILDDRKWVAAVSRQVAAHARRLHGNQFGHLDLKWRNILVTLSANPETYFIDCPAGRKRKGPGSRRWFIKDIACLDKVAKKRLTRTQRLRFFMDYENIRQLRREDKHKIEQIVRFFEGRE
jgi:tRNA A-37 threonylcarbamoyl transferase component Bud32